MALKQAYSRHTHTIYLKLHRSTGASIVWAQKNVRIADNDANKRTIYVRFHLKDEVSRRF